MPKVCCDRYCRHPVEGLGSNGHRSSDFGSELRPLARRGLVSRDSETLAPTVVENLDDSDKS